MVHIQIITRDRANIHALLRQAIQDRRIRSFETVRVKGGLKIQHKNPGTPGSISLSRKPGLLLATLRCNAKNKEWKLLEAFVGRMTYHFRADIAAMNIQFE